jgi:arylsulfatase A-like enzyme
MLMKARQPASLVSVLTVLTVLFVAWQLAYFIIHYTVTELLDVLVKTSVVLQLLHPVILLPLAFYILMQIGAYALFISWIWFITVAIADWCGLSASSRKILGIAFWAAGCLLLMAANCYFYPASFFATLWSQHAWFIRECSWIAMIAAGILGAATLIAFIASIKLGRYRRISGLLFAIISIVLLQAAYDRFAPLEHHQSVNQTKPNVILIGLDSVRPDFTGFLGNRHVATPNIDKFMREASVFTNAYSPLARTYPAWVSVLTAKYPKHNDARNNLVYPSPEITKESIAKHFQAAGYETIYATDEKRFSNITHAFGFDKVLGPSMGVNDFLLGGLTDFPMSNLLLKIPMSRFVFPFNYGNRAAHITYEPTQFLNLVKAGLRERTNQPTFLAVHLCLAHWPFTWARDGQRANDYLANQYQKSVMAVDQQLGQLMGILKTNGLLENSIVVMLSDHGTGLGIPGDRMLSRKKYLGDEKQLKLVQKYKLSTAPQFSLNKHDYTINTTYGQGTNIMSAAQYHVLMAFKRYGGQLPVQQIKSPALLVDIGPTLLSMLSLPPMQNADGVSLQNELSENHSASRVRPLFLETGDSMSEIETDHIYIEKVLKHQIGIYTVNPSDGLLMIDTPAAESIIKNKQLAVMEGDWMLAHFPSRKERNMKLVGNKKKQIVPKYTINPPYFVIANLKTQQWSIGLDSALAKQAPTQALLAKLKGFYQGEI